VSGRRHRFVDIIGIFDLGSFGHFACPAVSANSPAIMPAHAGIHVFAAEPRRKTWMDGTKPGRDECDEKISPVSISILAPRGTIRKNIS
jgi:hypothetical protein